jgi:formylglycine-generating enzyme required for sulfatase activity
MSFRSLPAGPNGLFSIGVYEVSQEQYEAVMGTNPSDTNGKQNPVDNVSWDDAVAYCAKLSSLPAEAAAGRVYRLPTEAEWDYACRAGTTTFYSFGDDERQLVDYAWFNENSGGSGSHPVGQKKPNGFGLYDMHGNEWEWCSDIEGSNRVSRGGSSDSGVESCRTANRLTSGPTLRTFLDGFRLAWSFPSGQSPEAEQGK